MKTLIVLFFLFSIAAVACAGNPESVQADDAQPIAVQPVAEQVPSPAPKPKEAPANPVEAKPTKGAAADLLLKLCTAVEKHDVDAILGYWHPLPEDAAPQMRRQLARGGIELNREALDKLVKFGKWGPISEVYPATNLARLMAFWEVDASQCWALRLRPAEVALYWDGKGFQMIECDDVNKPQLLETGKR